MSDADDDRDEFVLVDDDEHLLSGRMTKIFSFQVPVVPGSFFKVT